MGTPLLNERLEEAARGCSELAARAGGAASSARDVVEQAQALGTRAVDEAERLHREYAVTIQAIEHAGQQSGQAADAAAAALHSVTPEALKAATAVKNMLVAVGGEAKTLAEVRARAFHDLDESAHLAETGFHGLGARMHGFEEQMTARLGEAQKELNHFQDLVGEVTKEIEKAHQSLYEALVDLGHEAQKVTLATAHGLEQVLAAVANGVVDYTNNAINDHNDVVAAVRQGYLDEAKGDAEPASTYLGAAFDEARDALGALHAQDEPAHAELQSAAEAILQEGEKAVTGLGEVADALQRAAEVVSR